jgi:hypothetical protein
MLVTSGTGWIGASENDDMSEYSFTLTIEGGLDPERVDALYEAGCGDMTFQGDETGRGSADVHREAATYFDAVVGAIRDIERVSGLRVVEIEDQELVGLADIAWRLDRTQESARLLAAGKRGPGGFPAPVVPRRRGRVWRWSEVADWSNRNLGTALDPEESRFVRVLNAALALRHAEDRLSRRERQVLLELAAS